MLSGLQQRLLTAAVLLPLAIWVIVAFPTAWFATAYGVLIAIAAWEWARLCGWNGRMERGGYVVLVLAAAALIAEWVHVRPLLWVISGAAVGGWCVALAWIARFPHGTASWNRPLAKGVMGLLALVSAWLVLVALHGARADGPYWVLFVLVLVWAADSGAFFAGRRFGRRKLAPKVSPGKTWEGVAGGMLAGLMISLVGLLWARLPGGIMPFFVALSLVTVMFSVVGDLLVSMLKRAAGLKDTGQLLPGHGGILDRIDSVLAAGPLFLLGFLWMEHLI